MLDAHVILWAIYLPEKLSEQVLRIIRNPGNRRLVSDATQWELLNKVGRGRIPFNGSSIPAVSQRIRDLQVEFVPVLQADTVSAAMLPHHHSDPFDRMLIAQSIRLNCVILTRDNVRRRNELVSLVKTGGTESAQRRKASSELCPWKAKPKKSLANGIARS